MATTSTHRLAVGTTNICKLKAVKSCQVKLAEHLSNYVISSHKVESGINDQPDSMSTTIEGAQNRCRLSWEDAQKQQQQAGTETETQIIALGIESGLFFTETDGRCFDVCVCSSSNDGKNFNQGFSCAFELYVKSLIQKSMFINDSFFLILILHSTCISSLLSRLFFVSSSVSNFF